MAAPSAPSSRPAGISIGTWKTSANICDQTALRTLAVRGFDLVAATLSARAQPLPAAASTKDALDEETSTPPLILILGNEGFGLPAEITGLCSREIYIPMSKGVDSLNVVVAGGICMYALFGKDPGA